MKITSKALLPDAALPAAVEPLLASHPRLNIFWRPDLRKFSYHILTELNSTEAKPLTFVPDAYGTLLGRVPDPRLTFGGLGMQAFGAALGSWQGDINNLLPTSVALEASMCSYGLMMMTQPWAKVAVKELPIATVEFPQATLPAYEMTGYTNKVQSTNCGEGCVWSNKDFMHTYLDWEFTIEKAQLADWMNDVKKVTEMDLQNKEQKCYEVSYYWFRFGEKSKDYLSTAYGVKEPVFVEVSVVTKA